MLMQWFLYNGTYTLSTLHFHTILSNKSITKSNGVFKFNCKLMWCKSYKNFSYFVKGNYVRYIN